VRIEAGRWRGRHLAAPAGLALRPTQARVRAALFDLLGPGPISGEVIDLFAGSGSLGLEALSRGAARVVFVERAGAALAALRRNVEALGAAGQVEIVAGDALGFLRGGRGARAVDLLLADPPYGEVAARLVPALDGSRALLWRAGSRRVIECSAREPLWAVPDGWRRAVDRVYGETRIIIEARGEERE
jgi:16S rRNA (guanine966-N2)-methyltransferase